MPEYGILSITGRTSPDGGTTTQDQFTESISVSGNTIERVSPSVPAAKSGTLSTRTDDNTGVVAFSSGHGFSTSDVIDLFWSGGQRRGMTATVAGDNVTLDGGSGDVLPSTSTAVTGMVPVEVEFTVEGDNALFVAVSSPVPGFVVFVDDGPAEIAEATYTLEGTSGAGQCWISGGQGTNPLAGDTVTLVKFSHGSTSAQTMKAVAVLST
jgi:hypothetical protein